MDLSALFNQYDQAFWVFVGMWLFNTAVQQLPEPELVNPSKFYVFLFNFLHAVAANTNYIAKESRKRTIVYDKIRGTGDGTVTAKRQAIKEATDRIKKDSSDRLDAQASDSKLDA